MRGGIDLGGTKIQAVVVDDAGAVEGEERVPTPTSGGPADVAEAMADALRTAAGQAGTDSAELAGVGVGSPGIVDGRKGIVTSARNLPDWEDSFPLAGALADSLGTRVKIENDVQVATDAEFKLGAGRPYRSLLGVFWGTGVGGGIILKGKPWLGRGGAGEIGHIVVKMGGPRCPCGRRGCMEAYAGRKALEQRAHLAVDHPEHADEVLRPVAVRAGIGGQLSSRIRDDDRAAALPHGFQSEVVVYAPVGEHQLVAVLRQGQIARGLRHPLGALEPEAVRRQHRRGRRRARDRPRELDGPTPDPPDAPVGDLLALEAQ